MKALELHEEELFFIDVDGYREIVFQCIEKDDEGEVVYAILDMHGTPPLQRRIGYETPVLRCYEGETVTEHIIH